MEQLTERSAVKFVARIVPWLAPVPSAYFVARSSMAHLALPWPVALVMALVIEALGLTCAFMASSFADWNHTKRKTDPAAPVAVAFGLGAVYLITTLGLLAGLEAWPGLARYMPVVFPFLALVGTIALALIAQQEQREAAVDLGKEMTRQTRQEAKAEKARVAQEKKEIEVFARVNAPSRRASELSSNEALLRDGWTCYYCGTDMRGWERDRIHIDHFYPVVAGGGDSAFNLVVSCDKCNLSKHARIPSENEVRRFQVYLVNKLVSSTKEKVWALYESGIVAKQKDIASQLEISPGYVSSSLGEKPDTLPEHLITLCKCLDSVGKPSFGPAEPSGNGNSGETVDNLPIAEIEAEPSIN